MTLCSPAIKVSTAITIGILLILSSILTYIYAPKFIEEHIKTSLPLYEGSETYSNWAKIPIPIYDKFYFFNVTNVDEILYNGSDPIFEEVGPYVFREKREKVNITFNDDGTIVNYNQLRRWFHAPEIGAILDDEIYHLNVPMIGASDYVQKLPSLLTMFAVPAVNNLIRRTGSTLFPKHTIRQLLFEGYTDNLITESSKMSQMGIPSRFAWFLDKNGTASRGRYSIYTGIDDLNKLGRLNSWKNSSRLEIFRGSCNSLMGTSHELLPPFSPFSSTIKIFVGEICRPLKLNFKSKVKVKGVTLNRYSLDETAFDYSAEENQCYCPENGCDKNGVGDTSSCLFDSPGGISQPHFLNADPSYLNHSRGLSPDPQVHSFNMDIHPILGVAGRINAAMQVNVRIKREVSIDFMRNMKQAEIWFPIFWFSASAEMTDEMAERFLLLEHLPFYILISTSIMSAIGSIIIVLSVTWLCRMKYCTKSNGKLAINRHSADKKKNRLPKEVPRQDFLLLKSKPNGVARG